MQLSVLLSGSSELPSLFPNSLSLSVALQTFPGCRESRDEALLAEIAGNYEDEDKPLKEAYLEQFTK